MPLRSEGIGTSRLHALLAGLWRRLSGRLRWRLLWLAHDKFVVGVSGVLFDDHGRVLLLRHRYWTGSAWGLPGGYCRRGETAEEALRRELLEETRLVAGPLRPYRLVTGFRLRVEVHLIGRVVGGALALDHGEILAAEFFVPDALPSDVLPAHRSLIEQVAQQRPGSSLTETLGLVDAASER